MAADSAFEEHDTSATTELFRRLPWPALVVRKVDGEFVLESTNEMARRNNPTIDELRGRPLSRIYGDQPEFVDAAERCLATGERTTVEHPVRRFDRIEANQVVRMHCLRIAAQELVVTWEDVTPPNLAEAALRESEHRHRAIIAALAEGVVLQRADGLVLSSNPAADRILGIRTGETLGREALLPDGCVLLRPDGTDLAPWDKRALTTARDGSLEGEALAYRRADGSTRWLTAHVAPAHPGNDGDEPTAYVTTFADVTERHLGELALSESEQRYRQIFESTSEGIWCVDLEGNTIFANSRMAQMLGVTVRELEQSSVYEFLSHADRGAGREAIARRRQGVSEQVETQFVRRDGAVVVASIAATPFRAGGQVVGSFGMVRDVTEIRRAQTELEWSSRRLEMALEAGRMGTWEWNTSTRRGRWSPNLEKLFGYVSGQGFAPFLEKIHVEDRPRVVEIEHQLAIGGGRDGFEIEFRIEAEKDRWRWIRAVGRGVADADAVHLTGIVVDISERRRMEEQLSAAARMESIGRLAGGVAHDFNNLLTAIRSSVALLEGQVAEHQVGDLDTIRLAAESAADLTQQLLTFARMQAVELRVVDANAVVRDVERMVRRLVGADVEVVRALVNAPTAVRVDRGQLEQLIVNLVINARDAMPRGGTLTVRTDRRAFAEGSAERGVLEAGEYVLLAVTDTGGGIDASSLPHIFEPFFTTKRNGNGLGLATSYGIVKQLGGDIRVHTSRSGTCFEVYLPLTAERPETVGRPVADPRAGSGTILLVEDHELVRRATERFLERLGYRAVVAVDATAALEIAARTDLTIDLLMTDVVMPTMSGPELAAHFQKLRPTTGVLFVSGYSAAGSVALRGANFLQKPYTVEALADKLRTAIADKTQPVD